MPDVREAFEAVTAPPEPGAREREHRRQRRAVRKHQVGVLAVTAAIVIGIVVVALDHPHRDDGAPTFVDEPTVDAPPLREDDTYLLTIGDGTLTPLPSPVDGWSYRFSLGRVAGRVHGSGCRRGPAGLSDGCRWRRDDGADRIGLL